MKKYSNIPLKERKRNADRVYRHELRLEQINEKQLEREKKSGKIKKKYEVTAR